MTSSDSKFIFVFGTTGELIKIFPLITALEKHCVPIELWTTSQQVEELPKAIESLGINTAIEWLTHGRNGSSLRTKKDVLFWLLDICFKLAVRLGRMHKVRKRGGVIVHGDTMTTAIAALFAFISRSRVIHIEAGMRSGDIRNPFPEELSRRFVAKIADLNYAPGAQPVANLIGSKGEVIDTKLNTIVDALMTAKRSHHFSSQEHFGLVSLHRSELYENKIALSAVLDALSNHAINHRLVFIDHPVTVQRIHELELDHLIDVPNIIRLPKLEYFDFVELLSQADYVVTDSGGLQQECEITGTPCLVHRAVTESTWKLDHNIVLSELDVTVLSSFLNNPSEFQREVASELVSPTEIILNDFKHRNFIE
jgi:UDP-N-acetylglucosamine 2-epimerase (non-hydrolysing)